MGFSESSLPSGSGLAPSLAKTGKEESCLQKPMSGPRRTACATRWKFLEDDSFSTKKHCCKGCEDKAGCKTGGAAYSLQQDRWKVGFPRDPWLIPKTSPDSPPDIKTGAGRIGGRGQVGDKRTKKTDHVTTASPRKVICGPDVTAYLVDQVILWAAEFSKKVKAGLKDKKIKARACKRCKAKMK